MSLTLEAIEAIDVKNTLDPRSLDLSSQDIKDSDIPLICDYLKKHPNKTLINLSKNYLTGEGVKPLVSLKHISHLDLSRNRIDNTGAIALSQNETLQWLDVRHNQIEQAGIDALEKYSCCTYLNTLGNQSTITFNQLKRFVRENSLILIDNALNDKDIEVICVYLKNNPQIKELTLTANDCTHVGATLLAANQTLERLTLDHNSLDDKAACTLAENKTLLSLNVSHNKNITDVGAAALEQNKNFKWLNFSNDGISHSKIEAVKLRSIQYAREINQVREEGVHSDANETTKSGLTLESIELGLKSRPKNAVEKHLSLTSLNITDDDMPLICDFLKLHPEVTELHLNSNTLTGDSIHYLKPFVHITTINLGDNYITDQCAMKLAEFEHIRTLDLSCNRIGDMGASALAQHEHLTELHLRRNRVGSLGAQALAENTSITVLDLFGNALDPTGIDVLETNPRFTYLNTFANQSTITFKQIRRFVTNHELDLTGFQLNDNDILIICDYLEQHPDITTLRLGYNCCTSKGAKLLAKTKHITILSLDGNELDDEGVIALLENKILTKLCLFSNAGLTNKAFATLKDNKTLQWLGISYAHKISATCKMVDARNERLSKVNVPPDSTTVTKNYINVPPDSTAVTKNYIIEHYNKLIEKKQDFYKKASSETNPEMRLKYECVEKALRFVTDELKTPINEYESGTIDIKKLKTSVDTILATPEAKKEIMILKTHRSTKQFWIEFIGAIVTLGGSLIYKAVTGHTLFNQTDSANRLDAFKDSINDSGLSMKNK